MMGKLAMRSVGVLTVLFGLLFAVLTAAMYYAHASIWFALGLTVFIMALQYLAGPWIIGWIFKINWQDPSRLPDHIRSFLEERAAAHHVRVPRFGIIEDGNPNAFTFGHYPGDARIVATRGLLDMCSEEEVQAVLGHEFGHIVHWDVVVMTVAAAIVMALYYIAWYGRYNSRERRSSLYAIALAVGAFAAYVVAEYVALFLSRVREYYADRYSAEVTGRPNDLATSLVKIAYGLARSGAAEGATADEVAGTQDATARNRRKSRRRPNPLQGLRTISIFDPKMGASMALAAAGSYASKSQSYDPEVMVRAMAWDLYNPWGSFCELKSSHPLPAKRIRALGDYALSLGQAPSLRLPDKPLENLSEDFATDLLVYFLPILGLILGAAGGFALLAGGGAGLASIAAGGLATAHAVLLIAGGALLGLGLGAASRLHFMYQDTGFSYDTVSNLVGQLRVSAIRCIPARLKGRIIGRGIPGLFWSKNLVVEDETGFMMLDYRQPIGILEFFFGLSKAQSFVGKDVEVTGWYRRSPRPYLEVWQFKTPDGKTNTCWLWTAKRIGVGLAIGLGILALLAGLLVVM